MNISRIITLGGIIAATALAGCGGGGASAGGSSSGASILSAPAGNTQGSTSGSATSVSSAASGSTKVAFSIAIPSQKTTSDSQRKALYVSASTRSATITVTNNSQTSSTPIIVNCASNCATSLTAPVGQDTFAVALYDSLGGTGSVLSQGSTSVTILPGQLNTVNITFGGIVAKVGISMSASSFTQGVASDAPLTVTAYDADNNIIVGSQPFSSPIILSDTDSSGVTSLSNTTLTSPASTTSIHYSGGAMNGAQIAVKLQDGSSVNTSPLALVSTSTVADANVRAHMLTYAALPGNYHNTQFVDTGATAQAHYVTIAKYVDFLQTDNRAAAYAHNAGIKVGFYTDPVRIHGDELGWPSSGFARDCSGNLVIPNYPSPEILGNVNSPGLAQGWDGEIAGHLHDQWGSYPEDFVRSDDSAYQGQQFEGFFKGVYGGAKEPAGTPYCGYTDDNYRTGLMALFAQSPIPVIFNGDTDPEYNAFMQNAPNVLGSQCESCFNGWTGSTWQSHVNAEIGAVGLHKIFNSFSHGDLDANQQSYLYASLMMGFDPSYVSLFTDISTNSGFSMTPFVYIVPMQPTMTASNVTSYLQPEGVYVRQFAACYVNKQLAGPCASVVNADNASHPYPAVLAAYHHTATVSGRGILSEYGDNGSVSVSGPQAPSTLAPLQGFLVFQ